MKKKRHNYRPEEKIAILKRHLIDRVPVSDLCDQYHLQPTVFYRWRREFFENDTAAFETVRKRSPDQQSKKIEALEKKLQTKNEVLSELMVEHIKLKKILGSSEWNLGSPRHSRRNCGFPVLLGQEIRDSGVSTAWLGRAVSEQVRNVAAALWQC